MTIGSPLRITFDDFSVLSFESSYLRSNSYLVIHNDETFVVDTGYQNSQLLDYLADYKCKVSAVFLTHAHFDHSGTAKEIQMNFNCPVYVLEQERKILKQNNFLLNALNQSPNFSQPECSFVEHGFTRNGFEFQHCPGHTPGSALITFKDVVFTGDSVYAKSISLVDLPGENSQQLKESLNINLELLVRSQSLFPGHGGAVAGKDLLAINKQLVAFIQGDN